MNATITMPAPARSRSALRIAGSGLLLVVMVLVFPRHKMVAALGSIPLYTLAAVVPIYLALHSLGCVKWHLLVNRGGANLPFLQSVRCYYGGMFSNLFFPSVIGGDVVTVALGVSRSSKREAVVSGTLVSRMVDLAALLLLAGSAVVAFPRGLEESAERLLEGILAVFVGAGVIGAGAVFYLRRRVAGRIAAYWEAFANEWRSPFFLLRVLTLSLLSQGGLIALTAWLGAGCGLHLPMRAWLFAWPLAKLSAFVPLTLAGIGARELVLAFLLIPFGATPSASAGVGLAWDAVFIVGSLTAGVISKLASFLSPDTTRQ